MSSLSRHHASQFAPPSRRRRTSTIVDEGCSPDREILARTPTMDDPDNLFTEDGHRRDFSVQYGGEGASASPEKRNSSSDSSIDGWSELYLDIMVRVLSELSVQDISNCARACQNWYKSTQHDLVWKSVFARDFKIDSRARRNSIQDDERFSTWKSEYKRLTYEVPLIQVQLIRDHRDEVLHVSFSHDGQMFSTCSKDGFVKCWDVTEFPYRRKFQSNMKSTFAWKYTQYSVFNSSDTLLLVSGVHFGPLSTSGELVVFSTQDDFSVQCKVRNKPYDIFGSWLDDDHLFSGNLHWVTGVDSCCSLWISKASQELESERVAVMRRAYKFLNINGSSLRTLLVASPKDGPEDETLMIFSTGSQTYIPHQIGIKKLKKATIPFPGATIHRTLREAMDEHDREMENAEAGQPPPIQYDTVDHVFELNAQIIGLCLSPDQRYLFANCRSWPQDVQITDPFVPPPISSQIEIRCYDLLTLQEAPHIYRAHRAFTPSEECFFIFVDVSEDFVASGAEDSKGYIWDRHHNITLSSLQHQSVVNSVAFCPTDQETLVTVSDDYTIRVWFSRRKCREMGMKYQGQKICGVDKSVQCAVDKADADFAAPMDDAFHPYSAYP